jgi:hypothetical protein
VIMSFHFSFFVEEREDKCVIMSFRFSVFVERERGQMCDNVLSIFS